MAPTLCDLFSLLDLADRVNAQVDTALAPFGLTRPAYQALFNLSEHGCQTQKSLADRAGCAPSNITRLVDRLEKQGLVVRTPCPDDRRQVHATLTPAGEATFAHASEALEHVQACLRDSMTSRDGTDASHPE